MAQQQRVESEVAQTLDLSVIRYSRVVEDHKVLSRALQIEADHDVVMCITSSGDNVLNLLLDRPKKILAIDMSPAQNALLEIKLAAIQHLEYRDYLCLLGEKAEEEDSPSRLKLYQRIRASLPTYAQEFWDGRQSVIRDGMSEDGRLQRHCQRMHDVLYKSIDVGQVDQFMAAKTLAEQESLFKQIPVDKLRAVQMHFFKKSSQVEGRSEAQLKYVQESEDDICLGLWERLSTLCTKIPVKDNFYLSWWLRGIRGFDPETNPTMAPPFLTKDGFTELKSLVNRVEVVTCSIEGYLSKSSSPIHKLGLSDIFEYMSEEAAEATFALLAKSVAPGGRLAYWNLFNHRLPSKKLFDERKVTHLRELSEQLHKVDRAFFYSAFHVVQIN